MKRSEVAYLGASTDTRNQYGVIEQTITWNKVYVGVTSVSASEFFDGGKNGLRPEFRIVLFRYDYHGEELLKYGDVEYRIYRTYTRGNDEIELYVERRLGEAYAADENQS